MAAIHNARPASGRFPVVLYAGGLGSRSDANVELAEYLASHGYIVATVPQLGPSSEESSLETTAEEAEVHVGDLEFALKVLRNLPAPRDCWPQCGRRCRSSVRHTQSGGESRGGFGRLIRSGPGTTPEGRGDEGFESTPVGQVKVFLLDMRRANGVQGAKLDPALVDRMVRSDRFLVTCTKMFHGDFTEFGPIGLKLAVPLPPNNDGRTRETGFVGNQHAYRAALNFPDSNLKSQPEAMNLFLTEIAHTDEATIVHEPPLPSVSEH